MQEMKLDDSLGFSENGHQVRVHHVVIWIDHVRNRFAPYLLFPIVPFPDKSHV